MREIGFIKQNKEKWQEFEKILEQNEKDPDKLNDLFIQITDDLSYSRTFYPNRSVRVYLNNLAQQIFHSIYKNKRTKVGRLLNFWTDELPQLVYHARKEFRLSFLIFFIAFAIGAFSSAMDPEFPRVMLGDAYVDMTIANIDSGDPMAVYKEQGQFGMSLGITMNNLFVAFLTFVLGAVFAIGSAAIMVNNGIMVGAFQYFFYEQGLLKESFLTIWTHGTLEISAIIIAGAAGLTMGRGLVFPETLTRLQSFQISARRGLKIMIGIAPIIILAGFIEGYLTRYTETPDFVRALFILLCLAFILGYFVWYPMRKAKQGFKKIIKDTKIPPNEALVISFDRIKSSGEIFADIFIFYKKYFRKIVLTAFASTLFYIAVVFGLSSYDPTTLFEFPSHLFGSLSVLDQFFINNNITYLPILNTLIYTLITYISYTFLRKESQVVFQSEEKFSSIYDTFKILLGIIAIQFIFWTNGGFTFFAFVFAAPIIFLWMYIMMIERINIFSAVGRTFFLLQGSFARIWALSFLLTTISILFYSIMDTSFVWFYFEVIGWNLSLEQGAMDQLVIILLTFTSLLVLCLIFPILLSGFGLIYYTLVEINEAPSLKEKIKHIGLSKRIQGMERE